MGTAFCVKSVFSFRTARIRRDFAPGSPILRRFLAEQVPVLRWIGFFAEYGGDDVIEAIALKIEEEEPDFAHMIVRHPASLLLLDPSRGLVFDKVIDPVPGNGGLTLLLERAAAVSRGRFAPADIEESVPGDGKMIHIAFSNAGRAHHFDLRSDVRHAVFDFVSKLSDATADDGGMFVIPMIFGKYNALAHITRDDHAILTERLRWQIWVRPDSTTQV